MVQANKQERGLQYWMERVLDEMTKAGVGFKADPVHDLRVAIRRCRSIADGFRMLDPEPAWKKMRSDGKQVFGPLGDLRDIQVQMDWVERIGQSGDPVGNRLKLHFQQREEELKAVAAAALGRFDSAQWRQWAAILVARADTLPVGGDVFQVIALERWIGARRLHSVAMKSRSKAALHATRIGVKKFRYIVENFLPEQHDAWIKDLKNVQDQLGEIHDLDVLADTAIQIRAYQSSEERTRWRALIKVERDKRMAEYRSRMVGPDSLWAKWRSGLPSDERLRAAILKKFELWSSLRDPDRVHTEAVLETSLRLFDFLRAEKLISAQDLDGVPQRDLLTLAVLGHEVTRATKGKHHKTVVKAFERLDVPPGWSAIHLRIAGLVARYHTGAPPNATQRTYAGLRKSVRDVVDRLAGIIRLADALDRQRYGAVNRVAVSRNNGNIVVTAAGIHERTRQAERIARSRHLLESVCGLPIVVRSA
jgi:exopolyphosphatase/guanosine-5'-triphosphate,3'-diphosphate pyrophosphatase